MPPTTHATTTRPEALVEPKRPRRQSKGLLFFAEFLRSPFQIGALHESPPRVARALADGLGIERASAVVEYGPGTGPVTREIVARMPGGCRFFAVELNPRMIAAFRERNPGVRLYEGSAENVRAYCVEQGIDKLDAVVSSIPWILLPRPVQEKLLGETIAAMRAGARFSMITYRHEKAGMTRRFLDVMRAHFSEVEPMVRVRSRFKHAYVYRATR
jgi:phospholipid N-methyltransferase